MILESFQNVLAAAGTCALRLGHAEVTVTHVTYVLCTTGAMDAAFRKLGKDVKAFEDAMLAGMDGSDDFAPSPDGDFRASEGLTQCMAKAEKAARGFGRETFTAEDFLVEALQNEYDGPADDFARKAFLLVSGHKNADAHRQKASAGTQAGVQEGQNDSGRSPASEGAQALALWAKELVAAAGRGELDEVFGRERQIERVRKILARRKKSNPILLGEPGVGKTAVVEGLAVLIASGRGDAFLRGKRIYALDIKGLLAGTRNRGDLEERFKFILDAAAADPDIILFIDEIHTVMGAGGAMAGVADLMKPALASGKIRCIGATTSDEFARYISADPAMVRRFQEVTVEEPGRDEAVGIVRMAARAYELHHGVSYTDEAVVSAVDLSIRHMADRQLPDKALDILDEAGASAGSRDGTGKVNEADILRVVRDMSRDPFVGREDDEVWNQVASELAERVAGHASTIASMVGFLRGVSSHPVSRSGAKAAFLLSGPSGGGKRHLAESLAGCLGLPVLALDMGAYSERSAVSALVGAPPGYVGYEDGGKLTEFVRRHPACVLILDRIEMAHDTVRDLVSTAMAAGTLTDSRGRKVSFRNAIVIVTSIQQRESGSIGFRGRQQPQESEEGIAGMNFDRIFRLPLPDRAAAADLIGARLTALAASYRGAGVALAVGEQVADRIIDAGEARGGRAGDYVAAYVELFETELFKVVLPRRGRVEVGVAAGKIAVEVRNEMAS